MVRRYDLMRNPGDPHTLFQLGVITMMLGECDDAERYFVRYIEVNGETVEVLSNLALLHAEKSVRSPHGADGNDEIRKALDYTRRMRSRLAVSTLNPVMRVNTWWTTGSLFEHCGEHKAAIECWQSGLKLADTLHKDGTLRDDLWVRFRDRFIQDLDRATLASSVSEDDRAKAKAPSHSVREAGEDVKP